MVTRIIIIVSTLFLMSVGEKLFAQDPEFTQFYANPLYLNPAFAGTARCPRICLNYRNQWPGISGTYITYSASYDQHVDAVSGGLGLLVTNDVAGKGTLTTTNVSGIYSYQLNLTPRFSLKFGAQATYFQKRIDWSKLTFGDMIDAKKGFVFDTHEEQKLKNKSNVDFSAGILGYSKRCFIGFAVHHLNEPDEGLLDVSRLPMKLTTHAGITLPLGDKGNETSISPNILYQKQQNFQQLNLGLYVNKRSIVGGLWYRNQDSFIIVIGLQQPLFKIGYSYDVTVSKLTNATAGSHELSFSMQFTCKPKTKKFRTNSCPSF
ncbi:MAG: type IX secretion system membrane protein PorP/SprF [Bacteroidota bacterium]